MITLLLIIISILNAVMIVYMTLAVVHNMNIAGLLGSKLTTLGKICVFILFLPSFTLFGILYLISRLSPLFFKK